MMKRIGAIALLLPIYLVELGFNSLAIGAIVASTLIGTALLTLWVGLIANRHSRRILLLVLISSALAAVISYFAIDEWLTGFAYRAGINPLIFVISAVVAAIVSFVTVALQSYKTASADPALDRSRTATRERRRRATATVRRSSRRASRSHRQIFDVADVADRRRDHEADEQDHAHHAEHRAHRPGRGG